MNIKAVHFVQGLLGLASGAALATAQAYPAYATPCHLVSAVTLIALANLGLLSDSAVNPPGASVSSVVATVEKVQT